LLNVGTAGALRGRVTPPRRILPGTPTFVTRRCSERRFFLRPSSGTNEIFLYVLALAAQRYRVLVHALCVLSNHAHLVVTDVEGRLPAFMQYLDSLVARAVNASLGRFESFWAAAGSYSAIEPLDPSDVLAKIAYVLANPVAAGLVKRGAEWPGLWSAPEQIGTTTLTVRKPKGFFDPKGYLPESVDLELTVPPCFASAEVFRAQLAAAVRDLEEKHQRELASRGRRFLGTARVLAQSPFARPAPGEPRFALSPRIAARDKWKRIEGLFRMKRFEEQYRESRARWCSGMRAVVFPAGTYLMRIMYGVQCAGAA
jgi:REP element-mobilizing transposase RayT